MYRGKLEALYSAIQFINNPAYDYVVVSDSTVLANIDFKAAIRQHELSGAEVTILANREKKNAKRKHPLVLKADKNNKVTGIMTDTTVKDDSYVGLGMFIFTQTQEDSFTLNAIISRRDSTTMTSRCPSIR